MELWSLNHKHKTVENSSLYYKSRAKLESTLYFQLMTWKIPAVPQLTNTTNHDWHAIAWNLLFLFEVIFFDDLASLINKFYNGFLKILITPTVSKLTFL